MKNQSSTMVKPGVSFSGTFGPRMAVIVHLFGHRIRDPIVVSSVKHNVSPGSRPFSAQSRRQTGTCIFSVVVEKHCNMILDPDIAYCMYSPEQGFL